MIVQSLNHAYSYLENEDTLPAVISFDIFDTLVRRIVPPEYIKYRTSIHLSERGGLLSGNDPVTAFNKRKAIEQNLEIERVNSGQDRDYNYEQCIDLWIAECRGENDPVLANSIINYEISLELLACEAFKESAKILQLANRKASRVLYLTDMYLPKRIIDRILDKAGLCDFFDHGYVSAENFCRKDTGNLFKLVLDRESIGAVDLLHIGDNNHSDYNIPVSLGIRSLCIENQREKSRYRDINKLLTDYEQDYDRTPEAYNAIIVKAADYQLGEKPLPVQRDIAYQLSPVFLAFTRGISDYCHKNGIRKVYFLAREGLFLKRFFDAIIPDLITSYYLCVSRPALYRLSVKELNESTIRSIVEIFTGLNNMSISLGQILAMLGLDAETFSGSLAEFGLDPRMKISVHDEEELKRFAPFLSDRHVREKFEFERKQFSELFKQYLHLNNMLSSEPCLIVDIGWKGTMQELISDFLSEIGVNKPIHGYYFAYDTTRECRSGNRLIIKHGFFEMLKDRPSQTDRVFYNMMFEFLTTVDHGTTIGYRAIDGEVHPVFNSNPNEELQYHEKVAPIQRILYAYAQQYNKFLPFIKRNNNEQSEMMFGIEQCLDLILNPTYSIAKYFSSFVLYDNFFGEYSKTHLYDVIWWGEAYLLVYKKNLLFRVTVKLTRITSKIKKLLNHH